MQLCFKILLKTVIYLCLFSSFGQSKNLSIDSISNINSTKDFNKLENLFNNLEGSKALSIKYLNISEKGVLWAEKEGTLKQQLLAKYFVLMYHDSHMNEVEIIAKANDLKTYDKFLEMPESIFMLYSLKESYERTEQFNELLQLLPLYYEHIRMYGAVLNEDPDLQYGDIATIYYKLKNYDQSIFYYKKYLSTFKKKNKYLEESGILNNIGLCFLYENKQDSANYYFDAAIKIITTKVEVNNKSNNIYPSHFKNIINANRSRFLIEQKKYDEALKLLFTQLNSGKLVNEPNILVSSYYQIADVFYIKRDLETALKYVDSSLVFLQSYTDNEVKKKTLHLKAKCLLQMGKDVEADVFFNKYQSFLDSINKIKIQKEFTLATVKYNTKEKEKELIASKQKIAIEKRLNLFQYIGIFLLALSVIALYFLLKKVVKDKKNMVAQKDKTEKALKGKEILLKEVHHRVKNNLQIIASLLYLQSDSAKEFNHEDVKHLLVDGQGRIRSMALIHQKLYENEDLKSIPFNEYIRELIQEIKHSFLDLTKEVRLEIDAQDIFFDIDTALPLGLIINELSTNAFKYAYINGVKEALFKVTILKVESAYYLTVSDNGVGIADEILNTTDFSTLGLKLIKLLSDQLEGEYSFSNTKGTTFKLNFTV